MRFYSLIPIFAIVLSGCGGGASVSQNQCAAGDWQTLGYRDGVRGYRSSELLAHQDACGRYGVIPDRGGYTIGWEQGIREYCEPNNAFAVGEYGNGHNNACPTDMRADFNHAYQQGRSLYLARAEVANLERLIAQKWARLEQVKASIVSTAAAQLNPGYTPTQRVELLAKTKRLNDEKRQLIMEMPSLESEHAVKSRELDSLNHLASVTLANP